MLAPFDDDIGPLFFVCALSGAAKDPEAGHLYAVAARIVDQGLSRDFASPIRYRPFSGRDHYQSNLSRETLAQAPPAPDVQARLRSFLGQAPFVFFLDFNQHGAEIQQFCGHARAVDLLFAIQFFLPHLEAPTPRRLWERVYGRSREKISFEARELVDLAVEATAAIVNEALSDRAHPRAACLRHYLARSNTLFGKAFVHMAQHNRRYFGGLFDACTEPDTENWQAFLEKAPPLKRETKREIAERPVPIGLDPESIAARFQDFTQVGLSLRPSQVDYAQAVAAALSDRALLTVEAGTGTGKTQGYLVPAMAFLVRNPKLRLAVSTYTKSLQEQILQREIPLTQTVGPYRDIHVALLKGKSSYICAEKLDHVFSEGWQGRQLLTWLYLVNLVFNFRRVDIDGIGHHLRRVLSSGADFYHLVNEVSARNRCTARHQCCPAQVITAEAQAARLVVTNHHKLALLDNDPVLAGLFSYVIIDEANHFEGAVRGAYSLELRSSEVTATMDYLGQAVARMARRAAAGLLDKLTTARQGIERCLQGIFSLNQVLAVLRRPGPDGEVNTLVNLQEQSRKALVNHLAAIGHGLSIIMEALAETHEASDLLYAHRRMAQRVKTARTQAAEFKDCAQALALQIDAPEQVAAFQIFGRHFVLTLQPVDVAAIIREHFNQSKDAVIYTAATLTDKGHFDAFAEIVGLTGPIDRPRRFLQIPSPFDPSQVHHLVPSGAVNGSHKNKNAWLDAVVEQIPALIRQNQGRTLVLFASYADLEQVAARVSGPIDEALVPLLVQQKGQPTAGLCDEFRAVAESVLFGVDSFWYGVDFKGDTLTQVIITRLPYPSTHDPIQQARRRTMAPADYWRRYRYEAAIKLKQGMGRLIRSDTDRGRVVILDSRFRLSDMSGRHGPLPTDTDRAEASVPQRRKK
jgi:ATP-dependent DNA helicase DinG